MAQITILLKVNHFCIEILYHKIHQNVLCVLHTLKKLANQKFHCVVSHRILIEQDLRNW